jgi:hypothetical protein
MLRFVTLLCALAGLLVLCGCEKTQGNTPATKQETVAPQGSMESAYKSGGAPGRAAQK